MTPTSPDLLVLRGITKRFTGVLALSGVDFTLRAGEIHALMGENGAGKSTLIKVLTGVYPRDAGTIHLHGEPFRAASPKDAQHKGISTVYQEVNLIPELSVAENLFISREPRFLGMINWSAMRAQARTALQRLGLDLDVTRPVRTYSVAIQQMIAIARAVDIKAQVLILDEPTSSLDDQEVAHLFSIMKKLAAEGLGIVFVTHFLDQVYKVTNRITVLRNGQFVGSYNTADLPRLELIARMMGKDVEQVKAISAGHRTVELAGSQVFLSTENLGRHGSIQPISFEVKEGELLGLAGLLGSGRTELVRLIFGIDQADGGTLIIRGKPARISKPLRQCKGWELFWLRLAIICAFGVLGYASVSNYYSFLFAPWCPLNEMFTAFLGALVAAAFCHEIVFRIWRSPGHGPRQAIALGLGFCPEDRKVTGIVPDLSVRENMILALQSRRGWWRPIPCRQQKQIVDSLIKALNIKTADAEISIKNLSGGNQQKVILARWLAADPRLLILDEPTRGIDVGAKFEIAKSIEELRQKGMSIIFISSELEEVARICQRVVVLRDRKKVAEITGGEISETAIMERIAHAGSGA